MNSRHRGYKGALPVCLTLRQKNARYVTVAGPTAGKKFQTRISI